MTSFLDSVRQQWKATPSNIAFKNSAGQSITYGQLGQRANSLAVHLNDHADQGCPVVLLGHKEPDMLVGMFGSMLSGHAYVPLDASFPAQRVAGILEQLGQGVVIEMRVGLIDSLCSGVSNVSFSFISFEKLQEIEKASQSEIDPSLGISGSDVQYILFTSGSTGAPKGVMQTARTIDCTFEYFNKFIPEGEGLTFFNRTHFSFDVSLFDLCIALTHGHTMFALAENEEASLAKTFAALEQAEIDLWVSTPSFLDMCLVDPSFNSKLLPKLRSIVVCGETLHNKTASVCLERFPNAALYNTYGPTETQAITDVQITAAMAARAEALPIGTVSPFNKIEVVDVQTGKPLAAGQNGEIVILGSTIARGYFGRPDLTAKSFGEKSDSTGQVCQFYKTGDEGFLDEEGMLHYLGRLDLQVKINGFRIELEEIEHTLEEIPWVLRSCVVPVERGGVNTALAAHIVISNEREPVRETTKEIKAHLKETLPAYMIPRTVTFHDSFPQNVNGKVDRKALAAGVIGKKACGEASLNANSQS